MTYENYNTYKVYHAGNVVVYNGELWAATRDTLGNRPYAGSINWTSQGSAAPAIPYQGEYYLEGQPQRLDGQLLSIAGWSGLRSQLEQQLSDRFGTMVTIQYTGSNIVAVDSNNDSLAEISFPPLAPDVKTLSGTTVSGNLTKNWIGAACTSNFFALLASDGTVVTSVNGIDWVQHGKPGGLSSGFRRLASDGTTIMLTIDGSRTVYSTTDCDTWNTSTLPDQTNNNYWDIWWVGNKFIALVGANSSSTSTTLASYYSGGSWTSWTISWPYGTADGTWCSAGQYNGYYYFSLKGAGTGNRLYRASSLGGATSEITSGLPQYMSGNPMFVAGGSDRLGIMNSSSRWSYTTNNSTWATSMVLGYEGILDLIFSGGYFMSICQYSTASKYFFYSTGQFWDSKSNAVTQSVRTQLAGYGTKVLVSNTNNVAVASLSSNTGTTWYQRTISYSIDWYPDRYIHYPLLAADNQFIYVYNGRLYPNTAQPAPEGRYEFPVFKFNTATDVLEYLNPTGSGINFQTQVQTPANYALDRENSYLYVFGGHYFNKTTMTGIGNLGIRVNLSTGGYNMFGSMSTLGTAAGAGELLWWPWVAGAKVKGGYVYTVGGSYSKNSGGASYNNPHLLKMNPATPTDITAITLTGDTLKPGLNTKDHSWLIGSEWFAFDEQYSCTTETEPDPVTHEYPEATHITKVNVDTGLVTLIPITGEVPPPGYSAYTSFRFNNKVYFIGWTNGDSYLAEFPMYPRFYELDLVTWNFRRRDVRELTLEYTLNKIPYLTNFNGTMAVVYLNADNRPSFMLWNPESGQMIGFNPSHWFYGEPGVGDHWEDYWTLLPYVWTGNWSGGLTYSTGDLVYHDGKLWAALQTSYNTEPAESQYWTQVNGDWRGTWQPTTTYEPNSIVESEGSAYICIARQTGSVASYTELVLGSELANFSILEASQPPTARGFVSSILESSQPPSAANFHTAVVEHAVPEALNTKTFGFALIEKGGIPVTVSSC